MIGFLNVKLNTFGALYLTAGFKKLLKPMLWKKITVFNSCGIII